MWRIDRIARLGMALAVGALLAGACSSSSSSSAGKSSPGDTPPATVAMPKNVKIATVDPTARQTINGFGASGAWWPNDLIKFPADIREQVGHLLFSTDGIALSGYRYNVGGGGKGVSDPANAPKQYPDDVAGRTFLRMANDAGVPLLTGFVNSAPPQFTTNGQACGGSLKPGMEAQYAKYLVDIVQSAHDKDHITMKYVSPMNEPDDSFAGCTQEGMKVPVEQRAAVVQALGKELAARAPYAHVIADETTADAILSNEAPVWLAVPGTAQYLTAIAHHTYDFPNDALRKLVPPISAKFDKPTWMTEICCYKGSGGVATSLGANYDPTMREGFWLADQIESDFTVAGDSAWYWWTALSPKLGCEPSTDAKCPERVNTKGFNDGLIYYDQHGPTNGVTKLFIPKRYYVMGQFSRYVRPGAVRHNIAGLPSGVHALAFSTATSWTVVTWNENAKAASFGVNVPSGGGQLHDAVVTDATHDLQGIETANRPARTDSGAWLVNLPARAIATYTFSN